MTRHSKCSTRVWLGALACSVALLVGAGASPANAATSSPLSIKGVAAQPVTDSTCPRDPEFPNGINQRQQLVGIAWSHIGPAGLKLDVCRVFVGAIGGMSIQGSFKLLTLAGTLRGSAEGTVGFSTSDDFTILLTVERGSFLLSRVKGTMTFKASVIERAFDGTLTTDLRFGRHPVNL